MNLIKKPEHGKKINLIIIGAGLAGELIGKHILENPGLNYNLAAFIDDDSAKQGSSLLGVPIAGTTKELFRIASEKRADEVLIAIPSAIGELIRKILKNLKNIKLDLKILPGSFENLEYLEDGRAGFGEVRSLNVEDLFRRRPIITDFKKIKECFAGKTLLVTGGAGSIGSELCRQLLEFNPLKLIALDNNETALHDLNLKLKKEHPQILPVLADIKDKVKLKQILEEHKPSIIFHAAAYKHVPMMELYPEEAIKTNVFGTKNILDLVEELSIQEMVLISTDKAVNPKSVMGASKRITEIVMQLKSRNTNSKFTAVRFGNVLNSRGSVVPLFEEQIEKGGPVTVTHPDIERFFMTIPEATQLVIQASILGKSGDIFLLDMGETYNILKLAEDMIRIRGFEPYKDILIKIIGIRDGEKMYEELSTSKEKLEKTENERIFLISNNFLLDNTAFEENLITLKSLSEKGNKDKIITKLIEMLPNFKHQ